MERGNCEVHNSTHVSCTIPPAQGPGTVALAFSYDSRNLSSALSTSFEYLLVPDIQRVAPHSVPPLGGQNITLSGTGLAGCAPVCLIGGSRVPAVVHSDTKVICTTPPSVAGTVVNLGFSLNGEAYVYPPMRLTYTVVPTITHLYPKDLPSTGNQWLWVSGTDFEAGRVECFGDGPGQFEIRYISDTLVYCKIPPMPSGLLTVRLTNNLVDFSTGNSSVIISDPPTLSSLAVVEGGVSGGTPLYIKGSNLVAPGVAPICRFDMIDVQAKIVNETTVLCIVPRAIGDGVIQVSYSKTETGVLFSNSLAFTYTPPMRLASLAPVSGSVNGGTTISLVGSELVPGTVCRFGTIEVTSVYVSATSLTCATPAMTSPDTVQVSVSRNGIDFTSDPLTFNYVPEITASDYAPLAGFTSGGTPVTVTGSHYIASDSLMCKFGANPAVAAAFITESRIQCTTPQVGSAQALALLVSNNGADYISVGSVNLYDVPTVSLLSPKSCFTTGSTVISLHGSGFFNTSELACQFDKESATATIVSPSLITCVAPGHDPGPVPLSVTFDGAIYANVSTFLYEEQAIVSRIEPRRAPDTGNVRLTVSGQFFRDTSESVCKFGTTIVDAAVVTDTKLECDIPALPANVAYVVEVSNNNVTFSDSGVSLQVIEEFTVVNFYPPYSAVSGGVEIIVNGTIFPERDVQCEFGTLVNVTATVLSKTQISCVSPALSAPGAIPLSVRVDRQIETLPQPLTFLGSSNLTEAHPSLISQRGSVVALHGNGFTQTTRTYCLFGDLQVPGTVESSTRILCTSPPQSSIGVYNASVTFDGVNILDPVTVSYFNPPVISAIFPLRGVDIGGTNITMTGTDFLPSAVCRVGTTIANQTLYESSTRIYCITPVATGDRAVMYVSNNGQDYSQDGPVFYFDPVHTVSSIVPPFGTKAGGTSVTILGTKFTQSNDLVCKFGASAVTFAGTFVSTTAVTCLTPARAVGVVPVQVSMNLVDFGTDFANYEFLEPIQLSSVTPNETSAKGGDLVVIKGSNFHSSGLIKCKFTPDVVVGAYVDANTVHCIAPFHQSGSYPLTVSNNGIDYALTPLVFKFLGKSSASVIDIDPLAGSALGGTEVLVIGREFREAPHTICRFGAAPTSQAVFISTTAVKCLSPPDTTLQQGLASLEISTGDSIFTEDGKTFRFFAGTPDVTEIFPNSGRAIGGTLVTVYGSGFVEPENFRCHFGDLPPVLVFEWVSERMVVCKSPSPLALGQVFLRVSNNGVDVSSQNHTFLYTLQSEVYAMAPLNGPVTGGTSIDITGAHFDSYMILCRFLAPGLTTTGTVTSPTSASCPTPPSINPVTSEIEVSSNGWFYYKVAFTFQYQMETDIVTAVPASAPQVGGAKITLSGSHFTSTSKCRFGTKTASATFTTSTSIVCVAPAHDPELVTIEVTNNNADYTSSNVQFTFEPSVLIQSLTPDRGPAGMSVNVTVVGSNFRQGVFSMCRFGALPAGIMTYVTSTTVVCTSPVTSVATQSLALTGNDQDFHASTQNFVFHAVPSVSALNPGYGVSGMNITLSGSNLPASQGRCRIGRHVASALYDAGTLTCVAPHNLPETVPIEISANDGHTYFSISQTFEYSVAPYLDRLSPVAGLVAGGNILTLHGRNFHNKGPILAKVGPFDISPTFVSSTMLTLTMPAVTTAQVVNVSVVFTGTIPTNDLAQYHYLEIPQINGSFPTRASAQTQSLVYVFGSDFVSTHELVCKFGTLGLSNASFVSTTQVTCVTPPLVAVGAVPLSLSYDKGVTLLSVGTFTVTPAVTITSVVPDHSLSGGGTVITITGTGFDSNPNLCCKIGKSRGVPSVYVSPTRIHCISPPSQVEFNLEEVQVSVNCYTFSESYQNHSRILEAQLHRIDPVLTSTTGSKTLNVTGYDFYDHPGLSCKFDNTVSGAKFVSSTKIECTTPALGSPALLDVTVTTNNQEFVRIKPMVDMYVPAVLGSVTVPEVSHDNPSNGVTLRGSNFRDGPLLSCKFGADLHTSASFKTSEEVSCAIPSSLTSSQQALVSLSLDKVEYTSTVSVYIYEHSDLNVTSINPVEGLEHRETTVTLAGASIFDPAHAAHVGSGTSNLLCKFGERVSPGTLIGSGPYSIVCKALGELGPKTVPISVAYDGRNFVSSGQSFKYIPCPKGFTCTGPAPAACPSGRYCPYERMLAPTVCAPGSYQSGTGQTNCSVCPPNAVCGTSSLSAPQPCPAGQVCHKNFTGLLSGHLCTPSTYCPEGTLVPTIDDTSVPETNRPSSCPPGLYCIAGLKSSVKIDDDYSTAQTCFAGFFCEGGDASPEGSQPCPVGMFCPSDQDPTPCSRGHFCPGVGNILPTPCPLGRYQPDVKKDTCVLCPPGTYCPGTAMEDPRPCDRGFYCEGQGKSGVTGVCPAGFYCEPGTETTSTTAPDGTKKPIPCLPGTYCVSGVGYKEVGAGSLFAKECRAGSYCEIQTDSSTGIRCSPGFYSNPGAIECTPAPPGTFIARTGATIDDIELCPLGTYNPDVGQEVCRNCKRGHYCPHEEMTQPIRCENGEWRTDGPGEVCSKCPAGTWRPAEDTRLPDTPTVCILCPAGRICRQTGTSSLSQMELCSEGFLCDPGTSEPEILCPAGFACGQGVTKADIAELKSAIASGVTPSEELSLRLIPCPAGFICIAGTSIKQRFRTSCSPGFYCPAGTMSDRPADVREDSECPPDTTCGKVRCPEGSTSDKRAASLADCRQEYKVILRYGLSFIVDPDTAPNQFQLLDDSIAHQRDNFTKMSPKTLSTSLMHGKPMVHTFAEYKVTQTSETSTPTQGTPTAVSPGGLTFLEVTLDMDSIPHEMLYGIHYELRYTVDTPVDEEDWLYFPRAFTELENRHRSGLHHFTLYTAQQATIRFHVFILSGLYKETYTQIFADVIGIREIIPSRAIVGQSTFEKPVGFGTILYKSSHIFLPLNLGNTTASPRSLLTYRNNTFEKSELAEAQMANTDDFWQPGQEYAVLPYLPYFSNCEGYGSFIPVHILFEDSRCELLEPGATTAASPWAPSTQAAGDTCQFRTQCQYDEEMTDAATVQRWFQAPNEFGLFAFTKEPVTSQGITSKSVESALTSDDIVPVVVNNTQTNAQDIVPSSVMLLVRYYQVTPTEKRIIDSKIAFDNYVPSLSGGLGKVNYTLTFTMEPLQWFDLLNGFAFDVVFYLVVYFLIAAVTLIGWIIFWALHKGLIRNREKRPLRLVRYLRMSMIPPIYGSLLGLFPHMALIMVVPFLTSFFAWLPANRNVSGDQEDSAIFDDHRGRAGTTMIVAGLFFVCASAFQLTMVRSDQRQSSEKSTEENVIVDDLGTAIPLQLKRWKLANFMFLSCLLVLLGVGMMEFSYSAFYAKNSLWVLIVFFGLAKVLIEQHFQDALKDHLMLLPLLVAKSLVETAITLGAPDFVLFIVYYLIGAVIELLDRVYLDRWLGNIQDILKGYVMKVLERLQSRLPGVKILKTSSTTATQTSSATQEETQEEEDAKADMIFDISEAAITSLTSSGAPFLIIFLWLFFDEMKINSRYGLLKGELVYYFTFQFVILLSQPVGIAFIHNLQEYLHGWSTFEYLREAQSRLKRRNLSLVRPVLAADTTLPAELWGIDTLGFSPQFYALVSMCSFGIVGVVFGIQLQMRAATNLFSDPATLALVPMTIVVCLGITAMWAGVVSLLRLWSLTKDEKLIRQGTEGMLDSARVAQRDRAKWRVPQAEGGRPGSVPGSARSTPGIKRRNTKVKKSNRRLKLLERVDIKPETPEVQTTVRTPDVVDDPFATGVVEEHFPLPNQVIDDLAGSDSDISYAPPSPTHDMDIAALEDLPADPLADMSALKLARPSVVQSYEAMPEIDDQRLERPSVALARPSVVQSYEAVPEIDESSAPSESVPVPDPLGGIADEFSFDYTPWEPSADLADTLAAAMDDSTMNREAPVVIKPATLPRLHQPIAPVGIPGGGKAPSVLPALPALPTGKVAASASLVADDSGKQTSARSTSGAAGPSTTTPRPPPSQQLTPRDSARQLPPLPIQPKALAQLPSELPAIKATATKKEEPHHETSQETHPFGMPLGGSLSQRDLVPTPQQADDSDMIIPTRDSARSHSRPSSSRLPVTGEQDVPQATPRATGANASMFTPASAETLPGPPASDQPSSPAQAAHSKPKIGKRKGKGKGKGKGKRKKGKGKAKGKSPYG
eukprot:TRINITY_DN742_c0_g3_i1.p1 TRINITY_DN742_c0_g3~~TRINITY_DN742_c0_g3_i1.p1  ORF type:complete len:4764 (-),score=556.75 TRINITY_DN742_c0_g3_i1:3699-16238(-)